MRARQQSLRFEARLIGLTCLLLSGWPGPSLLAQEDDLYRVEVIVFARPALRTSYYRWPGEPDISTAFDLTPVAAAEASPGLIFGDAASGRFRPAQEPQPSPLTPAQQPFEPVDPAEFELFEDWQRLSESRDYQPLVHLAWRQQAATFGEPLPVRVHGGGTVERRSDDASRLLLGPAPGEWTVEAIDGTVALERGRFLHLRVDLAWHTPVFQGRGQPADVGALERPGSYFTFRLSERRRIQTGMVNYFDHQRFGLIARVEKWQPPDAAPPGNR